MGDEKPAKKGLGRGLDDLLAQHDTDLPFLAAYGTASGEHEEGLPASVGEDESSELLTAVERQLVANLERAVVIRDGDTIRVEDWLKVSLASTGGVTLTAQGEHLPLVPSDLAVPGLVEGELAKDRSQACVRMVQWGIESRRLLQRLCEHLFFED